VREIDVVSRVPGRPAVVSLSVTRRDQVRSIIRRIDALPIVQPGAVACPGFPVRSDVPTVTFTFRGRAGGRALAAASEPADVTEPTTACNPLRFSIRGRAQTPLLRGAAFLQGVQRLLGVTLVKRP
jgi:hypothetical protein